MRHAKRVDANQAEIVAALRAAGWQVKDMHHIGNGVPDLVVKKAVFTKITSYHERWRMLRAWVECKMPGEDLTKFEQEFADWAPGSVFVVDGAQNAVDTLAVFEKEA